MVWRGLDLAVSLGARVDLAPIGFDTAAVTALIDYAETARRALLAGEQAANLDEVRPCGHGSHLAGELATA